MRDYGVISPQFWTGSTGRLLRGNAEAQVLALYLMTSPHANMIGVYHCPVVYMSNDTGIPLEGASKALDSLCKAGFCEVDTASDMVFVVRMATYQVGETLKPTDNRVESVRRSLRQIGKNPLAARFLAVYGDAYGVTAESVGINPLGRGSKAPKKPRAGALAGTPAGADAPDGGDWQEDGYPDWLPREAWTAFVEMRKKIRAPLTDNAVDLSIRELEKLKALGCDPEAVLNQSVMNSWRGLFEIKGAKQAQLIEPRRPSDKELTL